MRLDLFLKASRLCGRRAVAQAMCEAGAVSVNGVRAKQSREVRVGDSIILRRHNRLLTLRVLVVPNTKQVSRTEASNLYEIIEDKSLSTEEQG
ncbi:MAG TPA: RNA-binding S4 domain-containing protein [Pyrinomonadaceae bacterium]|nr:RNA-binding S4 domain-containing protein [Pyrinomonadaceae bacterium]